MTETRRVLRLACRGIVIVATFAASLWGCGANASNVAPLSSQVDPARIVISAVELQFEDPMPGGQSVWLANRGAGEVDISCWAISAASSDVTTFVAAGTKLSPGRALRFITPPRMLRSMDVVTLKDRTGFVVTRTPELKDSAGDDQLWYLPPAGAWTFGRAKLPETASDGRAMPAC